MLRTFVDRGIPDVAPGHLDFPGGYSVGFSYRTVVNGIGIPTPFNEIIMTPLYGQNGDEPGDDYHYLAGPQSVHFDKEFKKVRFRNANGAIPFTTVRLTVTIGSERTDVLPIQYRNGAVGGCIPVMLNGRAPSGDILVLNTDNSGNLAVTPSAVPPGPNTSAVSNTASAIVNQTIHIANLSRLGFTIQNDSTANLYVKLGAVASLASYTVKIPAGGYYEVPFGYTGNIDGIWDAANGFAYWTELLA